MGSWVARVDFVRFRGGWNFTFFETTVLCDTWHEGTCHVKHGKVLGGHLENTWHGDMPCG